MFELLQQQYYLLLLTIYSYFKLLQLKRHLLSSFYFCFLFIDYLAELYFVVEWI